MAKPNYAFEKRQRELAKRKKKEEKAQRKSQPRPPGADDAAPAEEGSTEQKVEGHPDEVANPPGTDLDAGDDVQPTEPTDPDRTR